MGTATKTALVVLDNTVLTNFGLIRRPDLVAGLWPGLAYITPEVLAEYRAGVQAAGLPADAWDGLPVLSLTRGESAFALSLSHRLGAGERSCLAVAVNRDALLATDDRVARKYAQKAGLLVIGSVGVIIRNVQSNKLELTEAQSLLNALIQSGYRSPIKRLDEYFDEGR
jgi:predicted nucleic acid-binding protein